MGFVHIKIASFSMKAALNRPYVPVIELQMISAEFQMDVKIKLIDTSPKPINTDPHLLLLLHFHKVFISKLCIK